MAPNIDALTKVSPKEHTPIGTVILRAP